MNKKHLYWIIPVLVIVSIFIGMFMVLSLEKAQMGNYELYNCIYNNANMNRFNQHPVMIEKIQQECICFHNNNYTNLLGLNCSSFTSKARLKE